MGGDGQTSAASWAPPAGSIHLESAAFLSLFIISCSVQLCIKYLEKGFQHLDPRMCLFTSWLEIKGRVGRKKPLVIMFLLRILVFCWFSLLTYIPAFSSGKPFSLYLCPSRASRLFSPGAEGSGQEAWGGSRLGVWSFKLDWSFISFPSDYDSL